MAPKSRRERPAQKKKFITLLFRQSDVAEMTVTRPTAPPTNGIYETLFWKSAFYCYRSCFFGGRTN